MVQGNFANGDYFIDTPFISQHALQAISGVWINICVATIAFCIRFIFRSQVGRRIISGKGGVSLWHVSPAVTPSEAVEMRGILTRALTKRDFAFVFASTFCVVAAVVGAAGTVISNLAIGTNTVIRDVVVQGRLVTNEYTYLVSDGTRVSAMVDALKTANAPIDELFDFVPRNDSQWVYKPSQWNNTWKGNCSFAKYEAVELVEHPTTSALYQDIVPLLGNYIPTWATVNRSQQALAASGLWVDEETHNGTGAWRDRVMIYVFGSAPLDQYGSVQSMNISFVNYLAHHLGRFAPGDGFIYTMKTNFTSDVHSAECHFENAVVNGTRDQASANRGAYDDAAANIVKLYSVALMDASIAGNRVIPPTGQEMLRCWQAYMAVKDSQYPHPVARTLSVSKGVVQIRLSYLMVTMGAFLFATLSAAFVKKRNFKNGVSRIHLPSSQLDWTVQAAREHVQSHSRPEETTPRNKRDRLPALFASRNQGLTLTITPELEPRIATAMLDYHWHTGYVVEPLIPTNYAAHSRY